MTFMTERRIRVVSALQDRRVAYVAAAGMIRHYARFGNSAQQKRRTENESIDVDMFNIPFSGMNGQKSTFFINDYLDKIVTNNKKQQEHIITVKYQDKETSNPDEIIAIKKSLDESKQYELSTDYDQAGFINKLTITE